MLVFRGSQVFFIGDKYPIKKVLCWFYRGGQGLTLNVELSGGKTERCNTFDNPPLCAGGDFRVKVVEVYTLDAV